MCYFRQGGTQDHLVYFGTLNRIKMAYFTLSGPKMLMTFIVHILALPRMAGQYMVDKGTNAKIAIVHLSGIIRTRHMIKYQYTYYSIAEGRCRHSQHFKTYEYLKDNRIEAYHFDCINN